MSNDNYSGYPNRSLNNNGPNSSYKQKNSTGNQPKQNNSNAQAGGFFSGSVYGKIRSAIKPSPAEPKTVDSKHKNNEAGSYKNRNNYEHNGSNRGERGAFRGKSFNSHQQRQNNGFDGSRGGSFRGNGRGNSFRGRGGRFQNRHKESEMAT